MAPKDKSAVIIGMFTYQIYTSGEKKGLRYVQTAPESVSQNSGIHKNILLDPETIDGGLGVKPRISTVLGIWMIPAVGKCSAKAYRITFVKFCRERMCCRYSSYRYNTERRVRGVYSRLRPLTGSTHLRQNSVHSSRLFSTQQWSTAAVLCLNLFNTFTYLARWKSNGVPATLSILPKGML